MGNHVSCIYVAGSPDRKDMIKVLHTDTASISEFEEPALTVGELMMENPCQFVCCHSSLGHRICPIPADEELRPGKLYILLPMHKLNGRFSTEELAFFDSLVLQMFGSNGKLSSKASSQSNGKLSSKASSQSKVAPLPHFTTGAAAGVSLENSVEIGHPLRSLSAKLDVQSIVSGAPPLGSTHQGMICRSKSWIPKLDTIAETSMSMAF